MNILTGQPTCRQYVELPFTFAFKFLEAYDIQDVLEIHSVVLVDFVAAYLERDLSVAQIRMSRHLGQYFCNYGHSLTICAVDHKNDAVDIWIEKGPAIAKAALFKK